MEWDYLSMLSCEIAHKAKKFVDTDKEQEIKRNRQRASWATSSHFRRYVVQRFVVSGLILVLLTVFAMVMSVGYYIQVDSERIAFVGSLSSWILTRQAADW